MPKTLLINIQPFAIALALGLLIGIERERSHPPGQQPLGLRTFVLFCLLGAIASRLNDPIIAAAITLFVGAVTIAGYLRSSYRTRKQSDLGITTEVAAVVTYGLGFMANYDPLITLILGVAVLVVLLARFRLHEFSRTKLKHNEIIATTIILILALGIIPFLPNKPLDPWGLFNLYRLAFLILILAILQFASYVSIRLFGEKQGLLFAGFLSGFVSSTAATASISEKSKSNGSTHWANATAVLLATIAMFIQLQIIIAIISPSLIRMTIISFGPTIIIMFAIALAMSKYLESTHAMKEPGNPLALSAAVRTASFLFVMLILVSLVQRFLGDNAVKLFMFAAGMVEMQGLTLAVATLHENGNMTSLAALNNLSIALVASFITKYVLIWSIGQRRFAVESTVLLTVMVLFYVGFWVAVTYLPM